MIFLSTYLQTKKVCFYSPFKRLKSLWFFLILIYTKNKCVFTAPLNVSKVYAFSGQEFIPEQQLSAYVLLTCAALQLSFPLI